MCGENRAMVASRKDEVATRSQESNSPDLRLAINKVACKKQDSLIVQLFLNGYFYSKQSR